MDRAIDSYWWRSTSISYSWGIISLSPIKPYSALDDLFSGLTRNKINKIMGRDCQEYIITAFSLFFERNIMWAMFWKVFFLSWNLTDLKKKHLIIGGKPAWYLQSRCLPRCCCCRRLGLHGSGDITTFVGIRRMHHPAFDLVINNANVLIWTRYTLQIKSSRSWTLNKYDDMTKQSELSLEYASQGKDTVLIKNISFKYFKFMLTSRPID